MPVGGLVGSALGDSVDCNRGVGCGVVGELVDTELGDSVDP